jgi:hypothetical protein
MATPVSMKGQPNRYYTVGRGGVLYFADSTGNLTQISASQKSQALLAGADPIDVMDLQRCGCILTTQTAWN